MKYDTPYGKKSGRLLMLAMEAHTRDEMAARLIEIAADYLPHYPAKEAREWLARRKHSITRVEEIIDRKEAMT